MGRVLQLLHSIWNIRKLDDNYRKLEVFCKKSENIQENIAIYNKASNDCALGDNHKIQYLQNIFDTVFKRFNRTTQGSCEFYNGALMEIVTG